MPGDEPVYVLRRPPAPDSTYIDKDNNERNGFFRKVTSVGFWSYRQMVKVYDDTPPEIETAPFQDYFCALNGCTAEIDLLFDVLENCTSREVGYQLIYDEGDDGDRMDLDVNIYIKGRFPKQRISGDFPIGKHAFYLIVTDGCGNVKTVRIPFEVVDCKPPAPVCIERLAVELMPLDTDDDGTPDTGANTVWATDLIASEATDCSGVRYSINRLGAVPHPDSTAITVNCEDPEVLYVEVYAWDNAFNPEFVQPDGTVGGPNYSHCVARIFVQDNRFNLCGRIPNGGSIAGLVLTESADPVEDVTVSLSGAVSRSFVTDGTGTYQFTGVQEGYDYSIVPLKTERPVNGVTTLDLLLISKHILGVKELDSPYKLIAADINRSGSITTIDLIQMRKLILGNLLDFPNNTSWRFVRADYGFPQAANPWKTHFPELVNVNNLSAKDPLNFDFLAVKIGDVNESAAANDFMSVDTRTNAGTLFIRTEDREFLAGETCRVAFYAEHLPAIEGFQFTLDFDPQALRFSGWQYGLLQEANLGDRLAEEGMITASWTALDAHGQGSSSGALFELTFTAAVDGRLKDFLRLNSRYTPAEAYSETNDHLDVALQFGERADAGPALLQNRPNPFAEETVIGFELPEAAPATIEIADLNGRLLFRQTGDFPAGYSELILRQSDLPAAGVYVYTLRTGKSAISRKMILLGD